ncbi:tetratricopeptide repeat protein [Sneathiella aquimaris]|uniref:tetratricopeptide repeat protein n=1 Tax=Sneathiella aquimaris TaxID=2599305 RepID=UPI00146CB10C|nr:tetratricopeptide repeat protein [Sneathiella aquimaris]
MTRSLSRFGKETGRALLTVFIVLCIWLTPGISLVSANDHSLSRAMEYYQSGQFASALKIWKKLASEGEAEAQYNLFLLYEQGRGTDPDPDQARRFLNMAIQKDYAPALHYQALDLTAQDKFAEAQGFLIRAAGQSFPSSLYTLGKFYQAGLLGTEKPALAFRYISKAADLGHVKAQYNMGKMYRDGYGTLQNDVISTAWFLRAAKQGHPSSQGKLVTRYMKGVGVPKDEIEAFKWMLISEKNAKNISLDIKNRLKSQLTTEEQKRAVHAAKIFTPTIEK